MELRAVNSDGSQVEVASWRNFRQLHHWFVENYDGDIDDCKDHDVSCENVSSLVDMLRKIMQYRVYVEPDVEYGGPPCVLDEAKVEELSWMIPDYPPNIFGGSYDDAYFDRIAGTLGMLEPVMPKIKKGEITKFIYNAAW